MRWNRRDWLILFAVVALAAALRFYGLGTVPPGFQFDEAFNAIDARQVLDGNRPLFLPANGGREALYTYWQAALGALFGLGIYTLRLASALAGVAAVAAAYLLLRLILRRDSRRVAAFTSLTLAISFWHIHFSHYGIRVISMPPLLCSIFGLFWLGGHAETRARRLLAYAGSGLLVGLAPWTHPSGRFVPFILLFYVLWLLWRQPQERRWGLDSLIGGLGIAGVIAFLVFLPLGLEFLRHPEFFFGHASEVSIFADRVSGGNPWPVLANNVLHVVGMFNLFGDVEWAHNLAGRPVFDLLMSIPFLIGMVLWVRRLAHRGDEDFAALSLLAVWSLVMLLPSVLSEAAPNYSRTLPSLPAVFLPAGLGLALIASWRRPVPWIGPATAAFILTASGIWAFYDYFVRFPQRPEVYYLYDADKLDALDALGELTDDHAVYLSQLWGEGHATVLLLRGRYGVQSLDAADTVVLPPPGKGAVYAFPAEQANRAERIAALWPQAVVEEVVDRFGRPLITTVRVPADALQGWPAARQPETPLEARFFDGPTLLGMQPLDGGRLALFWRAEERTLRDLTAFVHLVDGEGRRVGQIDKLPGNGSYPTQVWRPGERVIDRYSPEIIDRCAGGEETRVQVGWYQYLAGNLRMPRTDAPGDVALAGHLTLPLRSWPTTELQPEHVLEAQMDEGLTLFGYALRGDDLQPGAPLTVDLHWRGAPSAAEQPLALRLVGEGAPIDLWQGTLAPEAAWREGEALCRRLHVRLPLDAAPGDYRLQVAAAGTAADLTTLELTPSTRRYAPPPVAQDAGVRFDEQIALHGYTTTVEPASETVSVTVELVWQALQIPTGAYKSFVHLIGPDGGIVTQSDQTPGGGRPTTRWLPGEYVVDRHVLTLPSADAAGYRLLAGLYEPVSLARLPAITAQGAPLADDVVPLQSAAGP